MSRALCSKYPFFKALSSQIYLDESENKFTCEGINLPIISNKFPELYEFNHAIIILPDNLNATKNEEVKRYELVLLNFKDFSIVNRIYSFENTRKNLNKDQFDFLYNYIQTVGNYFFIQKIKFSFFSYKTE